MATSFPEECKVDSVLYKENAKAKDTTTNVVVVDGNLCLQGTSSKWIPPVSGIMTVYFSFVYTVPTLADATPDKAIKIFEMIITLARSEIDRQQWVNMMTKDIYATTTQLQGVLDRFKASGVIGAGGLKVLDIIANVWNRILDAENCFDFINSNLDRVSSKHLKHIISLDSFKFNWKNPTGHYRIDLANPSHRLTLLKLAAINQEESQYSKNSSKRNDTSQKGNWNNFRNELYKSADNSITLDASFLSNLPKEGILEFDYISTLRPIIITADVDSDNDDDDDNNEDADDSDNDDDDDNNEDADVTMISSLVKINSSDEKSKINSATSQVAMGLIDEDEFYQFLLKLNLSRRNRMSETDASYALLDLQQAAAKYYFDVYNVNYILDCFPDSIYTQAKVIVALFSRIWDIGISISISIIAL